MHLNLWVNDNWPSLVPENTQSPCIKVAQSPRQCPIFSFVTITRFWEQVLILFPNRLVIVSFQRLLLPPVHLPHSHSLPQILPLLNPHHLRSRGRPRAPAAHGRVTRISVECPCTGGAHLKLTNDWRIFCAKQDTKRHVFSHRKESVVKADHPASMVLGRMLTMAA